MGTVILYYSCLLSHSSCSAPKKQYNNVTGLTSDTASIQYEVWITCYDVMMLTSGPSVSLWVYLRLIPPYSGFLRLRICIERLRHPGLSISLKVSLMYHVSTSESFQRERLISSLVDGNPRAFDYMIVDISLKLKTSRRFLFPIDTYTGDSHNVTGPCLLRRYFNSLSLLYICIVPHFNRHNVSVPVS